MGATSPHSVSNAEKHSYTFFMITYFESIACVIFLGRIVEIKDE